MHKIEILRWSCAHARGFAFVKCYCDCIMILLYDTHIIIIVYTLYAICHDGCHAKYRILLICHRELCIAICSCRFVKEL